MSIHNDDKAIGVIKKYGELKRKADNCIGEYYVVDCDNSSPDICLLFKNYRFPLVDYTKLQMQEFYVNNGYEEIMNLTWFCHSPVKGKPCGFCGPCDDAVKEGMQWRLSSEALRRHKHRKIHRYLYLMRKHLRILINYPWRPPASLRFGR